MMQQDPYAGLAVVVSPSQPERRAAPARPQRSADPYAGISAPVTEPQQRQPQQQAPIAPQTAPAAPAMPAAMGYEESVGALLDQGYLPDEAERLAREQISLDGNAPPPQAQAQTQPDYILPEGVLDYEALTDDERRQLTRGARVLLPADAPGQSRQIVTLARDLAVPNRDPIMGETRQEFGGVQTYVPGMADAVGAYVSGAAEQFPLVDEGAVLADALLSGQSFSDARDEYQVLQEALNRSNSTARDIGGVTGFLGSTLLPGAVGIRGLQGMTGAARTGAAALGAAPVGAAYGFASGEGSATDRAPGAVLGGFLGAGGAGVIDAGIQAAPAVGRFIGDTAQSVGQALNPSVEQRVGSALRQTVTRDDRMNIDELVRQLEGLTPGGLPVDVLGPNMSGLADVLVQTPGSAQTRLTESLSTRRREAPNRIERLISEGVGGEGNYIATLNNLIATRREAANEVIERIGPQQFQLDESAVRSLRSDLAQPELRRAAQNALASPDQQTYEMGANLMRLADTLRDNPAAAALDVRTAQDVSRALIDMGSDAWRAGDGSRGKALTDIGRAIRNNARTAVPEYSEWLARYGDESSQIEALELGRQVLGNPNDPRADGLSAEVLRIRYEEMSETAREMFKKGVAEALVARTAGSSGDVGAMRALANTREFRDRIRIAWPSDEAFEGFMRGVEGEVTTAARDNRMLYGSQTSSRNAARQRFGAADDGTGGSGPSLGAWSAEGAVAEVGRQGLRAALNAFKRDRSLIYNPEANDLLGRALSDREILARLLQRQPASGPPGSTQGADDLAAALQRASSQAGQDEFAFPPIATQRARRGGRQ